MNVFMKKKALLITWILFILFINLFFVAYLVLKYRGFAVAVGILSLVLLIFATICTVRRSSIIKKQQAKDRELAKDKMYKIDEILNK